MNRYTNLNLYGHLALELGADNNSGGTLTNVLTSDISFLRFTGSNPIVHGLDPGHNADNNKVLIITFLGTGSLTFKHLSTSNSSNNFRIKTPNGEDYTIPINYGSILIYDSYDNFWHIVGEAKLAAGSNGEIQFNNNGALKGNSNLTWDVNNNILNVSGTTYSTALFDNGKRVATLTGTETFQNKTLVSPVITGTLTFGEIPFYQYGHHGLSIFEDVDLSQSPLQTVYNFGTPDSEKSSVLSLSVKDEYKAFIGTSGYDSTNTITIGSTSNFSTFQIRKGTTVEPIDLVSGGTSLLVLNYLGQLILPTNIQSTSPTTGTLIVNGGAGIAGQLNLNDNFNLLQAKTLRFYDTDSSNYVGIKSPSTINSNYTLTLPATDGTNGQTLITNGSGTLTFGTIDLTHNNLLSLQGGGGGNYYHSNQPINSTDNVSFNNLTVVSGVNVTGSVKLNNITYPISDGSNGQVMTTDGSGNISFTTVASGGTAASGSGTILDTYINSKTSEINNNSSSNIQTIFSQAISGIYTFWVSTDPRIKGTFYFNENDPSNSVLESISSSVSSKQDNAGTLNIYISSVNVIIQNKLGSNITLCIRRETTPLINPEPGNVSISNHNNLYGLQGGATNTYYHSNQPINTTDNVTFSGINVNGDITATGTISTTNSVTFGSISIPITTSNATGTINDVSTANIGGYRFTSSSVLTITGFANGINGELLYLHNASSVNIIIKNSSSSSLNDNRILTGNGSDLILKPDKSISLQYDSFSLRWRVLGGSGGNSGENPETLDLSNSPSTIDFSQYSTTSFRIKNPAQITLTSGTNGVWYTLAIVSDGNYSFTSETRFPLNNAQPVPSSGTVDLYTFHCIDTVSGTRYLATFAYDYSGVTLP